MRRSPNPLDKFVQPEAPREELRPTGDNTLSAKLFCTLGFAQLVGRLRRAQRAWSAGERGDALRDQLRALAAEVDEELAHILEDEPDAAAE